MALSPGVRIGSYQIVAALGAGGMGEVYRATDTSLGRQVAIKVLPDVFAGDEECLARFEREARTLASLSHPNIAIVHGFERLGGTRALIMELVEGPTLADRIDAGRIPIVDALPVAVQIARALEAAHEQGIVHRDLKPANIKVTDDGVVKVLDFGLAKTIEPAVPPHGATSPAPTITTPAMTQAGVILGTAAYMSPEQAKGRPADKRSDVWAFGCVLYEMLTGRRAFPGEDTSDTLASILKTDPDWTALPVEIPTAIRTLIQRCLLKDKRERIADLAVASFVLAETSASTSASAQAGTGAEDTPGGRWRSAGGLVAAVLGTAVVVGSGAWVLRPMPPDRSVARFSITLSEEERVTTPARQLVALSPDGRQIAWAGADRRILVRSVSHIEAHAVPGIDGVDSVSNPVFSPDGSELAFNSSRAIHRLPIAGGTMGTVCTLKDAVLGLSWDPSGILAGQPGGIVRCAPNGASPEQLVVVAADEQAYGPQLLPGTQSLLFTVAKTSEGLERWDKATVVVQSLSTGERRTVIQNASDARYLPTGHLVYAVGGAVFAVAFDLAAQAVRGQPVAVLAGVRRSAAATTGVAHFSTSDSGHLVYVPGPARPVSSFVIAVANRSGVVTPINVPAGRYVHVRASRDGTWLAVETDEGKEASIATFEANGATALRRLTFSGNNRFPVWSPDGQRIAFQSDREGDRAIYVQRLDGTGLERLTRPEQDDAHVPESWSPDGSSLSFAVYRGSEFTLWIRSMRDGRISRFRDIVSTEPFTSTFSPDGRFLAYHALPPDVLPTSGGSGVYVEPFPPTGALYQAPKVNRDFQPVWAAGGRELLYVGSTVSGLLASVPVSSQAGLTFGRPSLLPFVLTGGRLSGSTRAFDALPGDRFVGIVAESIGDRADLNAEIRVVLNWFDELARLVPSGR